LTGAGDTKPEPDPKQAGLSSQSSKLSQVLDAYARIRDHLPSGPNPLAVMKTKDKEEILPFTLVKESDDWKVYLPPNLESGADCPLIQTAIAAITLLDPAHVELSTKDFELEAIDKKVGNYLTGVAWALTEGKTQVPPYRDVSGHLGHGYYYVCHAALGRSNAKCTKYLKGVPHHFTRGLTGKAWSNDLSQLTARISNLVSKAIGMKKDLIHADTWIRPKESFIGRDIKKSLPHKATKVLTEDEVRYLEHRFPAAIKSYTGMMDRLGKLDFSDLATLEEDLADVGKRLKDLTMCVDKLVTHRMSNIYPDNKREKRSAQKKAISTLISELSLDRYIYVFDPVVLAGKKAFRMPEQKQGEPEYAWIIRCHIEYEKSISTLKQTDGYLHQVCCGFFTEKAPSRELALADLKAAEVLQKQAKAEKSASTPAKV
jgi:hypothetical protein